jgi:hypothetical protein
MRNITTHRLIFHFQLENNSERKRPPRNRHENEGKVTLEIHYFDRFDQTGTNKYTRSFSEVWNLSYIHILHWS